MGIHARPRSRERSIRTSFRLLAIDAAPRRPRAIVWLLEQSGEEGVEQGPEEPEVAVTACFDCDRIIPSPETWTAVFGTRISRFVKAAS